MEREDKAGKGYVDFIFYPEVKSADAIILELKVGSTPKKAIQQIKDKNYVLRLSWEKSPNIREKSWQLESVITKRQRNICVRWSCCRSAVFLVNYTKE